MAGVEEKVSSNSFLGLGTKEMRETKVVEGLSFMPSVLLKLINAYDESFDKETQQLLKHVAQGEQEKAEAMLKTNRGLVFEKGTVTDLSKRTFKDITAFQYALWAFDWHMWTMLLKYLTREEAAVQCQELEEKGTAHGKHANWQGLIDAYTAYPQNYTSEYWVQRIGGAQLLLPAHVANEYCDESRKFFPVPDFGKREELSRSRMCEGVDWYDVGCGQEWSHVHGVHDSPLCRSTFYPYWEPVHNDLLAVASLLEIRQLQLLRLEGVLKKSIRNEATDTDQALQFGS